VGLEGAAKVTLAVAVGPLFAEIPGNIFELVARGPSSTLFVGLVIVKIWGNEDPLVVRRFALELARKPANPGIPGNEDLLTKIGHRIPGASVRYNLEHRHISSLFLV
jgi:hypothetical protein